jgi:hypothetical protein
MTVAHRWSYSNHVGSIPKGYFVMHHCDNRKCVRPEHLRVGTPRENSLDAAAKGRLYRRDTVRVTPEIKARIIERCLAGIGHKHIAAEFGVCMRTVRHHLQSYREGQLALTDGAA